MHSDSHSHSHSNRGTGGARTPRRRLRRAAAVAGLAGVLALQPALVPAADAAGGLWKPTGDLVIGRTSAASAVVGGKIFVTGGVTVGGGGTVMSAVELYRPESRTWTLVGTGLATARYRHTATALADGRVLVIGGRNSGGPLASAEVFDPVTEAWTSAGTLTTGPRYWHTATALPDGRVLVAGGLSGRNVGNPGFCFCGELISLQSAEVWDPETNVFTPVAPMSVARDSHTATLLKTGKVLIAGGYGESSAELFDPAGGSWTSTGSMSVARMNHTASVLKKGTVLVTGGGQGGPCCEDSAEVYDPTAGTWSPTGTMGASRAGHSATVLMGPQCAIFPAPSWCGKVLVVGLESAELFDRKTGTWTPTAAPAAGRDGHITALLPKGKVLVAGGSTSPATAEIFVPPTA